MREGVNRIKSDAVSRLDEVFRLLEDRGEDASEARTRSMSQRCCEQNSWEASLLPHLIAS